MTSCFLALSITCMSHIIFNLSMSLGALVIHVNAIIATLKKLLLKVNTKKEEDTRFTQYRYRTNEFYELKVPSHHKRK